MKQWLRDRGVNEVLKTGLRIAFNGTSWGKRPGWKYGAPTLAMATAISIRVREDKHHWRDVIAGGTLGYGVAMITVTPINATEIAPIIGPHWLGIRFSRSF